jgi:CheY-like chemotaxis protein
VATVPPAGAPALVLIVDDEDAIREVYRQYLEQTSGMLVFGAGSGEEAFRKLERLQPDIMVLDIALPDMSGLRVLERVRSHPRWRQMPVLLFTGHDLAGKPEGAVALLSKPLKPEDLRSEIEQVLRRVVRRGDA